MTSFEDRILELTRSEVDRIVADFEQLRKDAASVVDQLNFYGEPVHVEVLALAKYTTGSVDNSEPKPGPIVRPEPEQPASIDNTQLAQQYDERLEKSVERAKELTEKQKAYRERLDEQIRQDNEKYGKIVMALLSEGPKTLAELMKLAESHIDTRGRMLKTLNYLQDENRVNHRKERKYQGAELWYSFDVPVVVEQLLDEINSTPKGQELAIARFAKEQGFHPKNLKKMLDEQVRLGRITRRGGLYYNEKNLVNPKNGRSKSRDFSGAGVAMSNDKISSSKEVNALIRKAKSLGADVRVTGGDHIQVRTEMGLVTIGKTPSASGIKQDRERLKGIGLNV